MGSIGPTALTVLLSLAVAAQARSLQGEPRRFNAEQAVEARIAVDRLR